MDSFVFYKTPHKDYNNIIQEHTKYFGEEMKTTSLNMIEVGEDENTLESPKTSDENVHKVCVIYWICYLSYKNHSYIARDRVLAFAVREDDKENEVSEIKEITSQQEY